MKENEIYWIDENNNRWSKSSFTSNEALLLSKTLKNCSNCSGCSGCSYCSNCSGCSNCSNCSGCSSCSHCSNCSGCSNCSNCSYCSYCSSCSHCSNCSGCSYCSDFKENPERIVSGFIGSRISQTTIYFNNEKINVVCGCFKTNSLEKFEERIKYAYDKSHVHFKEYMTFINKVKKYMEG